MRWLDRLFRRPNPEDDEQVGLFGGRQAEIEGFALTSPKGRPTGRARPGQGTQRDLVSRKVSREQMERMRERELEERRARKKRRKKNDVFDQRAAEARDARAGAVKAGAEITRAYDIRGLADPAYIANVIEAELQRFEQDPREPVIPLAWTRDPLTGMTRDEIERAISQAPMPAGVDPVTADAARAAAVRLARSYATSIRQGSDMSTSFDPIVDFLQVMPGRIAEHLTGGTSHARIAEVEQALAQIQAHRRAIGMPPLDVHGAGWTEDDVLIEADRLQRLPNPLQDLKHRLI